MYYAGFVFIRIERSSFWTVQAGKLNSVTKILKKGSRCLAL